MGTPPDRPPSQPTPPEPIASTGSVAVDELLVRIADRSAKIAFLQEMTGALARAESLGELLDRTAEIAQRHLPYDVCSTHLVDPDSGRITVVLGSGPLFDDGEQRASLKVGEGIVGWVVQHGLIANVPDVRRDPRWVRSNRRVRAELAVPIRARGRTVGVFNLESAQEGAFTPYDEQIFSILAAQIGASMERVDLYREALDRARRLTALNQIARAIAQPLQLDRIFEIVADELMRLIPHDRTSLSLFDPESALMEITGVRGAGAPEADAGTRFKPMSETLAGDRPTLHRMVDADPKVRAPLTRIGIESYVTVPVRLEGELVAELNLGWRGPAKLPDGGLEFLSALGSHLAVTLKNARLYAKLTLSDAELSRAQNRLIQSAKLAAVGELAAGVAHELNNPLTGILGYTQWLLLELEKQATTEGGAANESLRGRLAKIEREVLRCKEIVQGLLNFSRAQEHAASREKVDMNSIVEATLGVTDHRLEMSKVKLVRSLAPGLPAIEANANQLQQVFTNIVINAVKAMPEGGSLTVATGLSANGSKVQVSFTDTGVGMSKAVMARIFEPFFTTRKVGEGTGLGLSVSYGLVEAHGGEIGVESAEGKGSTFLVALPVAVRSP